MYRNQEDRGKWNLIWSQQIAGAIWAGWHFRKEERVTVRDEWPQDEESEAERTKDCYSSVLKRLGHQVSVLGWSQKRQSCAPLAPGTSPCVCGSHWASLFPLMPIHTSTGNLLLPPSTITAAVLIAEICAMDFSSSSTADSGSQQMQRCQKHTNEILVFFFSYM